MAHYLAERDNWQDEANQDAQLDEKRAAALLTDFLGPDYPVDCKTKDLRRI